MYTHGDRFACNFQFGDPAADFDAFIPVQAPGKSGNNQGVPGRVAVKTGSNEQLSAAIRQADPVSGREPDLAPVGGCPFILGQQQVEKRPIASDAQDLLGLAVWPCVGPVKFTGLL